MTDAATADDPAMAAHELSFFRSALGAFAKSAARFQVVCTAVGGCQAPQLLEPPRPRSPVQRLVVLDSSFNPPTVAHMQMAASAMRELQQQQQSSCRLLLLLSVNNADKAPKPAAFEQRLVMMLAAAKDMHRVEMGREGRAADNATLVPPIDIGLTSQPYFPDKSSAIAASEFYAVSGDAAGPQQVFLVGFDTLIRIFDAKYYPASTAAGGSDSLLTPMQAALTPFLHRARLHVTTRPDDQWGSETKQRDWLQSVAKLGGAEDWTSRVDLISNRYHGEEIVSSTMARTAAKAHDWERLATYVSPSVLSWIKSQKLYGE